MSCPACGRALEPDARFCAGCGTPVQRRCAACGTDLGTDDRFCRSCGTPVAGAPPPPPAAPAAPSPGPPPPPTPPSAPPSTTASGIAERKVATMVFADLVGFTSLNESADPELVQALVTRAFDRLSAEVARYEGLVEKFAGDAMLAVFGVPATVHEDDAERAVRAALEMQSAMADARGGAARRGPPGAEPAHRRRDRRGARGPRPGRHASATGWSPATRSTPPPASSRSPQPGPDRRRARHLRRHPRPGRLRGAAADRPQGQGAARRRVARGPAVKARRGGVRPSLGMEAPLIGRDEEIGLIKETVRRTVVGRSAAPGDGRGQRGRRQVAASPGSWRSTSTACPTTFHWRKGRCLAYAQASFSALADAIKAGRPDPRRRRAGDGRGQAGGTPRGAGRAPPTRRSPRPSRRCSPSVRRAAWRARTCSTPGAGTWA